MAMKLTQPTQVLLTSAKEGTKDGAGPSDKVRVRFCACACLWGLAAAYRMLLGGQGSRASAVAINWCPLQHIQDASALAAEKAALEKELTRLKAEKEALTKGDAKQGEQKQQRGPFGLPFAFGGAH